MSESKPTPAVPLPAKPFIADAVFSLAIGAIFLMLGWPIATWAVGGFAGNPYGLTWQSGEFSGQSVRYRDVEGGTFWRDLSEFVTAIALIVEAIFLLGTSKPAIARASHMAVAIVGSLGLIVCVVAAVLQIKAGVTQPLITAVAGVVCLGSVLIALSRRSQ